MSLGLLDGWAYTQDERLTPWSGCGAWMHLHMSERSGPVYADRDYAGFVRRTVALVLDAVILLGFWFVMAFASILVAPATMEPDDAWDRLYMVWWLLALLYLLVFRMTLRGTLGYRLVGIRYAHMLSDRPAWSALAYRAAIAMFLLWIFALDHLWILFNRHKQAWHDKVAGFYVVRSSAQPIGTRRVVRRVINFMMLTFVVWEPVDSVE